MKTSLVILTRNDVVGLKEIYKDLPLDTVEECFVIDGQSKDGTADFCKEKGLRMIVQEKMGRGEAMRIGAREAKGDYIIFLDNDISVTPDTLSKLVAFLESHEKAGIVTARLVDNGTPVEFNQPLFIIE